MRDTRPQPPSKVCVGCGRRFDWRRKWAKDWPQVRYCSRRCRGRGLRPVDHALEAAILQLLAARAASSTICPSEAARAVRSEGWRDLMEATRAAARRLAADDRVVVRQGGRPVDPSRAKGPIRLGRGTHFGGPPGSRAS